MKRQIRSWCLVLLLTILFAGTPRAADDDATLRDLTAVLALLSLPCGMVVAVEKKGVNDHIATCENGSRYRIYLNADGRVIAEKQ